MDDKIHITLSPWDLSDSYNRHTGVTLVSILENCSKDVVVHLLYEEKFSLANPEAAEDTIRKYLEIGDTYHAEIQFHKVDFPDWVNDKGRKNLQHFTPGALLRLYLPELLSEDIDKVLYFDCDMVVLTDIVKIWLTSLDNFSVAAVLDAGRDASLSYYLSKKDRYSIDRRRYFNTGFLVMNLKRIRLMKDFPKIVMNMIFDHPEYPYPDQDVLNLMFQENDTLFLDAKYNVPVGLRMTDFRLKKKLGFKDAEYSDCILHFNGTKKPWKIYSGQVDEMYWDYLRKTPWGKNKTDVDLLYAAVRAEKKTVLDRVMSTPLNRYLRLAEAIVKRI